MTPDQTLKTLENATSLNIIKFPASHSESNNLTHTEINGISSKSTGFEPEPLHEYCSICIVHLHLDVRYTSTRLSVTE